MRHNPAFASEDVELVRELIRANPWATLVSTREGAPVASHYPVLLDEASSDLTLLTHLGRPDEEVLEIDGGGTGAGHRPGPPWLYLAELVRPAGDAGADLELHRRTPQGVPQVLSEEENLRVLTTLVERFEKEVENPAHLDQELGTVVAKGTVGLRIPVERFQLKRKLSQNKDLESSPERHRGAARHRSLSTPRACGGDGARAPERESARLNRDEHSLVSFIAGSRPPEMTRLSINSRRWPTLALLLLSAALLAAGCGGGSDGATGKSSGASGIGKFAGAEASPPKPAASLELRNSLGQSVNLREYRGKAVLVTFIYTHCPDVCPLIVSHLKTAQALLGPKAKGLEIVAVSTDPRGDNPKTVSAFLRDHAMSGRMQYLIGNRAELGQVWKDWNIVARPDKAGRDLVEHSALVYGIGADGRITTLYPANFTPSEIVHDVPLLERQ